MSEEHVKELPRADRASKTHDAFVGDIIKVGKFAYKVTKGGKMTSSLERLPSFVKVDGDEKVQVWQCPNAGCAGFMTDDDYKNISLNAECECGNLIAGYKAELV